MILNFRFLFATRIVIIVLIIFSVITVCQAGFAVNTPTRVVTCQNTLITWGGGAAGDSYHVQIVGRDSNGIGHAAVADNIPNEYWNWFVEFPANTSLAFIEVRSQSTGQTADSADFTVQAGDDQTCIQTTSSSTPVGSTPGPGSASATPTLANSSGTSSSTSTSSGSSGSITGTSGSLTSLLPLPPLLSRTSTRTSSDPTGVSSPSLGDTGSPSSSPNVGLIAGATACGSVVVVLLLLGGCLYRRRKRSAGMVERIHPIEMGAEEALPFPLHHSTYARYDSAVQRVKPYPYTNSHETSALTSQTLHSKQRMPGGTGVSLMIHGHNIAVALATPAPNTTTTPGDGPTNPPATSPNHNAPSATFEPIEEPPPIYQDGAEAQIQSQRVRAEEAERVRRYDALTADFCASNRDLISPALERKLYTARYLPEDNPSDVAADYWLATYGVGPLELSRLQAAYERHVATQELINTPENGIA